MLRARVALAMTANADLINRTLRLVAALLLCLCLAEPVHAAALSGANEPAPAATATAEPAIAAERTTGQDALIADRIGGIFTELPSLSQVTVAAEEGVVTLGGTVADAEASARAGAIASRVTGVVTVENNIQRDVSVGGGFGLGPLREKASEFTRMLPLIGAGLLVALLIAGLGYLLASLTGLWRDRKSVV